ncbi:hypothetical protein PGTUg99_036112 [Puccinia graminis f. sp. tritici]|uniref:Uncharacterized protein n=1 Tax=Puccinia graminis f. sp. tritici TaxID=56615 RepID=A0A5B0PS67_PUCGR|nr:hypothetical protein PGTUg99_036112 [Puccinia graminis f. sp. tritici]
MGRLVLLIPFATGALQREMADQNSGLCIFIPSQSLSPLRYVGLRPPPDLNHTWRWNPFPGPPGLPVGYTAGLGFRDSSSGARRPTGRSGTVHGPPWTYPRVCRVALGEGQWGPIGLYSSPNRGTHGYLRGGDLGYTLR